MKKLRRDIILMVIGFPLFLMEVFAFRNADIRLSTEMGMFAVTYLIIAFGVADKALESIKKKKILNEYLMILIATACSFLIYQYVEGIAVLLLFQAGSLLEGVMMHSCEKSIAKLMDISPGTANRKEGDEEVQVEPRDLECGDILVIKPGEKVPVDCMVLAGASTIDVKALTGESLPQTAVEGTMIYSGSINLTGVLEAEVVKEYKNSTASRILAMVRRANDGKSDSESSVTRFTAFYIPLVMILAVLLAVVPPLTFADRDWYTWIYRALTFLIVACPWGMVISIPITFYGGIGAAARQGVMIKSNRYLELLTKADTFVFDKTGTLTKGVFEVREIVPVGMTEEELLDITAHVESFSNHPISFSLMQVYNRSIDKSRVQNVKELPGYGIRAVIDGKMAYIGNRKMMWERRIAVPKVRGEGTVVYVALDGAYAGYILIGDILRGEVRETMDILKRRYHKVLVMLTGDNDMVGKAVGKTLKMDYIYTNLLPAEKVERIEEFLESEQEGEKLVYVGDGINDAPVLKRADIGIAMGNLGADAAVEAADIVLMEDETELILTLLRIARETMGAIRQNLVISLGIKTILLLLAATGLISMWTAIVADVMIVIVTLFNAMWLLRYPS